MRLWFRGGLKAPPYGIYADFFDEIEANNP
jgi:hypothetical protein